MSSAAYYHLDADYIGHLYMHMFWAQVAIAAVLAWNDVVMQDGRCGSAPEGDYFCHKCRLPR